MTVYSPDDTDMNADWSKRTWDLPKTVPGFMTFLLDQAGDNEVSVVEQWQSFQKLPSSRAMPTALRVEVEAILFGGPTVRMAENTPRQVGDDGAPSTR